MGVLQLGVKMGVLYAVGFDFKPVKPVMARL